MKFLLLVLFIKIRVIINQSLAEPIDFSTFCSEVQRNLTFRYAIRVKQLVDMPETDSVFFFTDDTVFQVPALTNAVQPIEKHKHVLHEILFNEPSQTRLRDFMDIDMDIPKEQRDHYNTAFCDWKTLNKSFWLMGDKYREYIVGISEFKSSVKTGSIPIDFSESKFGFMKNEKIKEMGFENIIGVVFSYTWSPNDSNFSPIQVYVKGDRADKMSSFQFDNPTKEELKYKHGYTNFNYQLDSAVYLSPGRSLASLPIDKNINHYFDIRTYKGGFSLFDFSYNQDNLYSGTNEELLGCAPSFCQTHQFDAIVRFPNGNQKLIYREFSWDFSEPFERIEYKAYLKTNIISRKKVNYKSNKNLDFAIRNIIDGTFVHNQVLYIFRNGSFIDTTDNFETLNDVSNAKKFATDFKDIANQFKGVPSQFYDAVFYHKRTSVAYFILDDMFWAYSMVDQSLYPKGEQYPKLIQELGLPPKFRVKATYVEENENHTQIVFYFFGKKKFLTYNATLFNEETNRFDNGNAEYRCTSEFLGCPDNDYFACPPDEESDAKPKNFLLIILIVILVIAILVIIVLAIVLYVCLIRNKDSGQKGEESATDAKDTTSRGTSDNTPDNVSTISRRSQNVVTSRGASDNTPDNVSTISRRSHVT